MDGGLGGLTAAELLSRPAGWDAWLALYSRALLRAFWPEADLYLWPPHLSYTFR
jgi:hypothetical protein